MDIQVGMPMWGIPTQRLVCGGKMCKLSPQNVGVGCFTGGEVSPHVLTTRGVDMFTNIVKPLAVV